MPKKIRSDDDGPRPMVESAEPTEETATVDPLAAFEAAVSQELALDGNRNRGLAEREVERKQPEVYAAYKRALGELDPPPPARPDHRELQLSPDVQSVLSQLQTDRGKLFDAAEALIMAAVDARLIDPAHNRFWFINRYFPEHKDLFATLSMDEAAVARESGRCRQIRFCQREAGSRAEREAARDAQQSAREELAAKGPDLRQRIEDLQAQLQAMESALSSAEADVARREQAVERFKADCIPERLRRDKQAVQAYLDRFDI